VLIFFTPRAVKSERQDEAPLRSLMLAGTEEYLTLFRRGASSWQKFRASTAAWPVLSPATMPRAPNVMLAGRPIGIVSQMAGAIPRAVSHVAHDHAGELTEVNRALPGS
jgi:hypothetical protein